jgi:hypothetical protein
MSENNLHMCPNCKKGKMQPAGKIAFLGETEEPFREIKRLKNMSVTIVDMFSLIRTSPERL